jgi:AcrR family transcriptional regulator
MAGGRHDEREAGTPRDELARLRARREVEAAAIRGRIERAMLEACGEWGYRNVSVQRVIDRYGGNRAQFYRHYGGKAACFEAAYEAESAQLVEEMLGAGRTASGWRAGLRAALGVLALFVAEHPAIARGLLVEVHVAGGGASARRAELAERLAAAIDSARHDSEASENPPPLTARFMLGAVDSAAASALARGEAAGFPAVVPELAQMIVTAYFGEAAAAEEPAPGSSRRARRVASSAPR